MGYLMHEGSHHQARFRNLALLFILFLLFGYHGAVGQAIQITLVTGSTEIGYLFSNDSSLDPANCTDSSGNDDPLCGYGNGSPPPPPDGGQPLVPDRSTDPDSLIPDTTSPPPLSNQQPFSFGTINVEYYAPPGTPVHLEVSNKNLPLWFSCPGINGFQSADFTAPGGFSGFSCGLYPDPNQLVDPALIGTSYNVVVNIGGVSGLLGQTAEKNAIEDYATQWGLRPGQTPNVSLTVTTKQVQQDANKQLTPSGAYLATSVLSQLKTDGISVPSIYTQVFGLFKYTDYLKVAWIPGAFVVKGELNGTPDSAGDQACTCFPADVILHFQSPDGTQNIYPKVGFLVILGQITYLPTGTKYIPVFQNYADFPNQSQRLGWWANAVNNHEEYHRSTWVDIVNNAFVKVAQNIPGETKAWLKNNYGYDGTKFTIPANQSNSHFYTDPKIVCRKFLENQLIYSFRRAIGSVLDAYATPPTATSLGTLKPKIEDVASLWGKGKWKDVSWDAPVAKEYFWPNEDPNANVKYVVLNAQGGHAHDWPPKMVPPGNLRETPADTNALLFYYRCVKDNCSTDTAAPPGFNGASWYTP